VDGPRPIRPPIVDFDRELADVAVAVQLVASGGARRVTLSGLLRSEEIAPEALALAQASGVRFAFQRDRRNGSVTIVVGPVEE
jgi:hypothetical protein